MKRILAIALATTLLFVFTACAETTDQTENSSTTSSGSVSEQVTDSQQKETSFDVESILLTSNDGGLRMEDGTFLLCYNATYGANDDMQKKVMKYNPITKKMETLVELSKAATLYQSGHDTVWASYFRDPSNSLGINVRTGETKTLKQAKSQFPFTEDTMGHQVDYRDVDSKVYYVEGTEFATGEKNGYTWYEYPASFGLGEWVYYAEVCSDRYLAIVYGLGRGDEIGFEYLNFLVYDYQTGKKSEPMPVSDAVGYGQKPLYTLVGNFVTVDGMLLDVSRVFEDDYVPAVADVAIHSVSHVGNNAYYRVNETIYKMSPDGAITEVYTFTADERHIWDYCVTESGKVVVLVDNTVYTGAAAEEECDRAVYVGDTCVTEDVTTLACAYDNGILVRMEEMLSLEKLCLYDMP